MNQRFSARLRRPDLCQPAPNAFAQYLQRPTLNASPLTGSTTSPSASEQAPCRHAAFPLQRVASRPRLGDQPPHPVSLPLRNTIHLLWSEQVLSAGNPHDDIDRLNAIPTPWRPIITPIRAPLHTA